MVIRTLRTWLAAAAMVVILSVGAASARDPQGALATGHGAGFEGRIAAIVEARGIPVRGFAEWAQAGRPGGEWLLTNAPYVTLYGSPGRTEFLLLSPAKGLNIRIEAKWQQSAGSVDEKLPYLYLNALHAMPEPTIFIVIDGPGWRRNGLDWLRRAAAEKRFAAGEVKDVRVMTLADFSAWADTVLGPR